MLSVEKATWNTFCYIVNHNIITIFWYRRSVNKVRHGLSRAKGNQQKSVVWSVMAKRETAHEVPVAGTDDVWCRTSYATFQLGMA